MDKEVSYVLPKEPSRIAKLIADEWNRKNPLYIERYLAEDFKYIFYGKRDFLGNHILNKRQYLIWWDSTFDKYAKSGVTYERFYTEGGYGIACNLNNFPLLITLEIVDGIIFSAKEIIPRHSYNLTVNYNNWEIMYKKQLCSLTIEQLNDMKEKQLDMIANHVIKLLEEDEIKQLPKEVRSKLKISRKEGDCLKEINNGAFSN